MLIPAGTTLFFPVSISGRDPDAFAEADSFDPERADARKHGFRCAIDTRVRVGHFDQSTGVNW